MIQPETVVKIVDNTGGKSGKVFKILGGSRRRYAQIGDVVALSVRDAAPRKMVKKKDVVYGIVVRQRNPLRRRDGSYIRFDENAVVLVEKGKTTPRGARVFGPIPREVAEQGYQKIASLATEVV